MTHFNMPRLGRCLRCSKWFPVARRTYLLCDVCAIETLDNPASNAWVTKRGAFRVRYGGAVRPADVAALARGA